MSPSCEVSFPLQKISDATTIKVPLPSIYTVWCIAIRCVFVKTCNALCFIWFGRDGGEARASGSAGPCSTCENFATAAFTLLALLIRPVCGNMLELIHDGERFLWTAKFPFDNTLLFRLGHQNTDAQALTSVVFDE